LEQVLHARPDAVVSVDTYHADTARAAARTGAEIVNDVSGLTWDPSMAGMVAQSGCGLVLMHARGRSGEWQSLPGLDGEAVVPLVFAGLCEQLAQAEAAGIRTERIVLDPGFGFGKRGAENFALLGRLGRLRELGRPLLVGLSRKGFLGDAVKPFQHKELPLGEARRIATAAANVTAILAGAHVLRVHDLQAAQEAAAIADAVLTAANPD
jgi:dihydropteroate synthase